MEHDPHPTTARLPQPRRVPRPNLRRRIRFNSKVQLLGTTPDSKGAIDLYTENEPCPACDNVIEQFRQRFPGVKLNVTYTNVPK
ncbi:deaminase domain-containing protein [Nocardia sp. KC 131]|uniref:deaminase domain-containing protein n=1 Tax=Nocardia arseniciresistens TaxID=3392119 RepID=UPI00398F4527